jgi:cytoskeletal protein CcmA (bactofilin family)
MSDAIILTSQQPGDPQRSPRSSAPPASGGGEAGAGATPSLVPAGFVFEGTVAFHGRARIDGKISGPVEGIGRLEVGPAGDIVGDVRADEVVVAGAVAGDLEARERVEIQPGGRVRGSIRTAALQMHDGALVDGRCAIDRAVDGADSGTATDGCAG